MIEPRVRFSRQIRLPEIGEHGQARLSSSDVRPTASGFARVVESLYLAHAGVRVVEASDPAASTSPAGSDREGSATGCVATGTAVTAAGATADDDPLAGLGLRHAAAREIADGALRALRTIRGIVDEAAREKASS